MFEVEPNLWLQSFASPWLTALMKLVSFFGYDWVYAAAVVGLGFGWRLKPMLGVMLALLLASTGTHAVKDGMALPRPVQVDVRVQDKGHPNRQALVELGGATTMLGLPTAAAIEASRRASDPDYGFLSGHVAAATALCMSLLLWRPRKPWIRVALIGWPVLMAVSRMYLGRHFLADVLAGAVCGAAAAVLGSMIWRAGSRGWLLATAVIVAVAFVSGYPWAHAPAGQLLGLAASACVLDRLGWPEGPFETWARAARIVLAFAVYAAAKLLLERVLGDGPPVVGMLGLALATVVTFVGSVALARSLGLSGAPAAA